MAKEKSVAVARKIRKQLERGILIREELNEVLWKRYEDLSIVFAAIFREEKGVLKQISDLNYYQGGYPSPSSPPRIESVFKRIGIASLFFDELGRLDEFNTILADYGYEIKRFKGANRRVRTSTAWLNAHATKAFKRLGMTGKDLKGSPRVVLARFLALTYDLQAEICGKADEIKITLYNQAKLEVPRLGKPGFVGAVAAVANRRIKDRGRKGSVRFVESVRDKVLMTKSDADLIDESITKQK